MHSKRTVILWTLWAVLFAGVFVWLCSGNIGRYYNDSIYIDSPDGGRLIIREWSALGGAGADISYDGKCALFEREIGHAVLHDYHKPFELGEYEIEWGEGTVTVRYNSGTAAESSDDVSTWTCETFDLP